MSTITVDTARLPLLLHELRLPAVSRLWQDIAARADKEGWPAIRFLAALAELELAERARRRVERHLVEARLPPGKTLDTFDFNAVPMLSKAHVIALASGDTWLGQGRQPVAVRPTRQRQEPCRSRARSGADRERLPRAVHAHHRHRPAPSGGTAGAATRRSHRSSSTDSIC